MAHIGARILSIVAPLSIPVAIGASAFLSIPFAVSAGTVAAAVGVVFCAALAAADADLRLLSLGKHKGRDFDGKNVVIVGASSGIGAALAVYLAKQGAVVVLSSRGKEQLQVFDLMWRDITLISCLCASMLTFA
jgi:NADPH:quinone reductase-like Zn-dependent oxidoreductase